MADNEYMADLFDQEIKSTEDNCQEHTAPLLKAIHSADICVLYQTPNLCYTQAENLPLPLAKKWFLHCREKDLFSPAVAIQMEQLKKQVLSGGPTAKLEVRLPQGRAGVLTPMRPPQTAEEVLKSEARAAAKALEKIHNQDKESQNAELNDENSKAFQIYEQNGQALWFKFAIEALRDDSGKVLGVVTTGVNISELRAREEVLRVLLREVSHRSKNLLAIIQSIAAQTARFCHDIDGFLKKFQGRLQSLSSSQDLVTDSDWRGALLQDLIFAQTSFYTDSIVDKDKCSIIVEGENPYLFPSAALHVGLALHELIINSASYGALAKDEGEIKITCQAVASQGEDKDSLVLSWQEHFPNHNANNNSYQQYKTSAENDNQTHDDSTKSQFGSIVLEKIVPISVDGDAEYSIKNGNIEYYLNIPVSQYSYESK